MVKRVFRCCCSHTAYYSRVLVVGGSGRFLGDAGKYM